MRRPESCPVPSPDAPLTCRSGPLARYAWLIRTLAGAVRRLIRRYKAHPPWSQRGGWGVLCPVVTSMLLPRL
jgi:hypothetical protein